MNKIIVSFLIVALFSSCTKNDENKDRFSNYELLSTKEEIIPIKHIKWAATDRPGFVTQENYNAKKNDDSLIDYCFYLDTKEDRVQGFSEKEHQNLQNGRTIRVSGKFYRTKKFDAVFPYKEFCLYSFTPKNGYFIVFVYDTVL